jgi:hypothetical protein
MGFNIEQFANEFQGGARAYLFEWEPSIKTGMSLGEYTKVFVKSSTFPGSSVEEHVVEYQGVNFKSGGKQIYEDWTISFNLDIDGKLRKDFEKWIQLIYPVNDTEIKPNYYSDYKQDLEFKMLGLISFNLDFTAGIPDFGGVEPMILNIKLKNAWPKSVGPITLDYSSQDFAQFDVTFSYQYHVIT